MVLIYLVVCSLPYFSLIPPIDWGINAETQGEVPPIPRPLLPPQKAEVHQPTPRPATSPTPVKTTPIEPQPAPPPDFFST